MLSKCCNGNVALNVFIAPKWKRYIFLSKGVFRVMVGTLSLGFKNEIKIHPDMLWN